MGSRTAAARATEVPPARPQVGEEQGTTRDRLIEAAVEAFAEHGFDRTRMQDVARRAGLTTGSIYASFTGKGELLAETVETAVRSQDRSWDELADVPATELRSYVLDQAARWVSTEMAGVRGLVLEAHAAARREPLLQERLNAIQSERVEAVHSFARALKDAGALKDDVDPYGFTALLFTATLGITMLEAAGVVLPDPAAWRSTVSWLLDSARQA